MLESLGFIIEHFHDTSFIVRAMLYHFHDRDCNQLITDLIDSVRQDTSVTKIDKISKKLLAYLACKSAIKSGDPLSTEEAKILITLLQKQTIMKPVLMGDQQKLKFQLM